MGNEQHECDVDGCTETWMYGIILMPRKMLLLQDDDNSSGIPPEHQLVLCEKHAKIIWSVTYQSAQIWNNPNADIKPPWE